MLERGLVEVYTGDGKGKTTAALGLALRAAGQGLTVHVVQFMKGWPHYGELAALPYIPRVTLRQFGRAELVHPQHPEAEDFEQARLGMEHARRTILAGEADVVILDEVTVAVEYGLVPLDDLLGLLEVRPPTMELVVTGRGAPAALIERADLVTEMREIKHPFQQGMLGRKGIEY
ncbi:MAG: cob(I)yrinic acid a,c-diamide adenosyltransferase [Bradymonadales bacterium]|nr:cob(I)yrinic acid a,c-diamide adenosyltransferase [Bradymonadales bacterium]